MANLELVTEDAESGKMPAEKSVSALDQSCVAAREKSAVPSLIPAFADACRLVDAPYSCLVVESHRRHVALSPMYLQKKKTGIREQLDAELLKYSENLKGVPLAYDNIKVLGQHGDIYDDNGFIHMNIEATFVIFQPKRGQKLSGIVNKIGVGHVGCLVHGCFNAAVPRPPHVTQEAWLQAGLAVGSTLEFQVAQLDADAAGVLLIRGRLDKHRAQSLAQVGGAEVAELTEEPTAKKKKKAKTLAKDCPEASTITDGPAAGEFAMEMDEDMNGHDNDRKKKKKKKRNKEEEEKEEEQQQGSPVEVHISDSSGYHSDKSHRKRKQGEDPKDRVDEPERKKKKKTRSSQ